MTLKFALLRERLEIEKKYRHFLNQRKILGLEHVQWVVVAIVVYMQSKAMLQTLETFHSLETPYYSNIAMP